MYERNIWVDDLTFVNLWAALIKAVWTFPNKAFFLSGN